MPEPMNTIAPAAPGTAAPSTAAPSTAAPSTAAPSTAVPSTAARSTAVSGTVARIRAFAPAARFILQGDSAVRAAAANAWGVALSDAPCRAVVRGSRATLWLGPGEFLLWDAVPDAGNQAAIDVQQALQGLPHSWVDVSHRQIAWEITGPHAEPILNGACPLDLDVARFPEGMCTRTVFGKAEILLWRKSAATFHVEVWRSFAAYFTGLLGEIGSEYA